MRKNRVNWFLSGSKSPDTTADGKQGFLVIGDSTARGAGESYGPTPTANTVYQVDKSTQAITQITTTDMNATTGTTGSQWPAFGIDYYTKTGKKPMILNWGHAGTSFGDWVSTDYALTKPSANLFLSSQGLTKFKAIFIHLGVNDINTAAGTLQTNITSLFNSITTDFPNTPIFIEQPASSARIATGITTLRTKLKQACIDYTNIQFFCDFGNIYANGYFQDAFHPSQAGCTQIGKMASRAIVDYGNYSKWALSIIAAHYDDLSGTVKTKINTFINTIGAAYFDLDCLYRWKTTDTKNIYLDFAFFNVPIAGVAPTFTNDDSISFNGSTQYIKSGLQPSTTNIKQSVGDAFYLIKVKTNNNTTGTQYAFGAVDLSGTNTRSQFIQDCDFPATNGRINVQPADFSNETTAKILNNTCYGARISGGSSLSMLKNGVDFGLLDSSLGALTLQPLEIFIGGTNQDGGLSNPMNFSTTYFASGKYSTVNQVTLYNALEALL